MGPILFACRVMRVTSEKSADNDRVAVTLIMQCYATEQSLAKIVVKFGVSWAALVGQRGRGSWWVFAVKRLKPQPALSHD